MVIDIQILPEIFHRLSSFDVLLELAQSKSGYIVGGAVRDALTDSPVTDVDLVFPEDPTSLAKEFAVSIGGSWFWLDESRKQSRVVVPQSLTTPDFDFAPFRALTLGQDLLDRDFTINSIAISFDSLSGQVELVDPLCGLEDLESAILRMSSPTSFANDPLRIIKGIRHATAFDLVIEPETLQAMQKEVTELYRIAPERIRQEVWKVFTLPKASLGLQLMSQAMVGNYLFGNEYSLRVNHLCEALDSYRHELARLADGSDEVVGWLAENVEQGLNRKTLLLWTLVLLQLDKELPSKLAEEWLLSRKAKGAIASLCTLNDGHTDKFASLPLNPRSFVWWADFLRIEPVLLLLALSLLNEDRSQAKVLLQSWLPLLSGQASSPLEDLVNGHWLCSELGLKEGPEIATAQRLVRHAEIIGDVSDEATAKELLRQYYTNMD